MPPDIGFVLCTPGDKFAFNRAYPRSFGCRQDNSSTALVDNVLIWTVTAPTPIFIKLTVRPEVLEWSSNVYTLDYIFSKLVYIVPPNPTENPAGCAVSWETDINELYPLIMLDPFLTAQPAVFIPLPGSPSGWWSG